jgi:O-antigen/teichoic acid export membrane protein
MGLPSSDARATSSEAVCEVPAVDEHPVVVESSARPEPRFPWGVFQPQAWWRSARDFISILRLRPFNADTPEDRSKERYRRAALTSATSMMAGALGIFTGLAWIRLSLSYLGKERYGLWMTVGSLVAWGNLADFGLARGMQNHLSEANGRDDRVLASRYVSTGLIALSTIALAMAVLALPFVFVVPWTSLLNVHDPSLADETRAVVVAAIACFLLQFPLSIVPTIYAAYQRGYVAALFSIAGSLFSLATLFAVVHLRLSLPWLILATSGAGIALTMVNLGYALTSMPWLRPRLRLASLPTLRSLGGTSVALFVFQIGALLIAEAQALIIARRLGLSQVTDWSVFLRVYSLPAIFIQMLDTPLIPAFREAYVRGERDWLRTAFWRITKIKLAVAVIAAGLYFVLGNTVAKIVGGHEMSYEPKIWAGSGLLLLVSVWGGSFNDLLIAVDRLRLLVVSVLLNGLVTPLLSYFVLAPRLGLFGALLAMPLFSVVVTSWLMPWACRDLISRQPDGGRLLGALVRLAGWPVRRRRDSSRAR